MKKKIITENYTPALRDMEVGDILNFPGESLQFYQRYIDSPIEIGTLRRRCRLESRRH